MKDDRFLLIMIIALVYQRMANPLLIGKSESRLRMGLSFEWLVCSGYDNCESLIQSLRITNQLAMSVCDDLA